MDIFFKLSMKSLKFSENYEDFTFKVVWTHEMLDISSLPRSH